MKINVLIGVFAITLLYTTNLTAQIKKDTKLDRTETACVSVTYKQELVRIGSLEAPVLVSRKRDLINSQVNSKIKCSIDLFTIVNDKAAC